MLIDAGLEPAGVMAFSMCFSALTLGLRDTRGVVLGDALVDVDDFVDDFGFVPLALAGRLDEDLIVSDSLGRRGERRMEGVATGRVAPSFPRRKGWKWRSALSERCRASKATMLARNECRLLYCFQG